jgi:hypothetical protein
VDHSRARKMPKMPLRQPYYVPAHEIEDIDEFVKNVNQANESSH